MAFAASSHQGCSKTRHKRYAILGQSAFEKNEIFDPDLPSKSA
jgi:hypothetical protein